MQKQYAMLAVCQLNQWAMSFTQNKENIIKSIREAKALGATYRLGPEMEVSGYTCEDHFFEIDTIRHSWDTLAAILTDEELTKDILVDIGMPLYYKNTLYNCRVLCLNQRIILIRPKMVNAGANNYREGRWFTQWRHKELLPFELDAQIR